MLLSQNKYAIKVKTNMLLSQNKYAIKSKQKSKQICY